MQVIPSNTNMTNGVHVFETPDDIIINSQIYDKTTMTPKPYHFWNIQTYKYKNYLQQTVNILENQWGHCIKGGAYQRYIQDNRDPNIFYVINESNNDVKQYLVKVKKSENGYTILGENIYWSGERPCKAAYDNQYNLMFIGQTNDYIILWSQGEGYDYTVSRVKGGEIIRIQKSDMTATYNCIGFEVEAYIQALEVDTDKNVMWLLLRWGGSIYIGPYNIDTNSLRWVWTDISENYRHEYCPGLSDVIKFKGYHVIFTNKSTHDGYQFQMFSINKSTESVVRRIVPCKAHSNFPYHQLGKTYLSHGWLVFTLKNIDDTYIAVTAHNAENAIIAAKGDYVYGNYVYGTYEDETIFSTNGWHRHVVYEYSISAFIPKDVIDMGNDIIHLYGVLYYDQYTCVFFSNDSFQFWKFNPSTEKYEKGYEKSGTFYTLGFDELKRFYTFDSNNVCKIYTNITACVLNAEFPQSTYNYDNVDIPTYVTVSAKNFNLEHVATNVTLTLTGPCVFANGKREYSFTTAAYDMDIPVTIIGGGAVHCHIKQVEVDL